jgi:hypothetical protein
MTLSEQEKEERARQREAKRLAETLEREEEYQKTLVDHEYMGEDLMKLKYLNKQLLRRARIWDWDFLREVRKQLLRRNGIKP